MDRMGQREQVWVVLGWWLVLFPWGTDCEYGVRDLPRPKLSFMAMDRGNCSWAIFFITRAN